MNAHEINQKSSVLSDLPPLNKPAVKSVFGEANPHKDAQV